MAALLLVAFTVPLSFIPDSAHCSSTPACKGLQGYCCPTTAGNMLDCCVDLITANPHLPDVELHLPKEINDGADWCDGSKRVSLFIDSLTLSAAERLYHNVTSGEFLAGGGVNIAVGASLLFAPIIFGPSWPTYLAFVLSSMLGAIMANKLMKKTGWLTGDNRSNCAGGLGVIAGFALGMGFVSLAAVKYAFFAMGAAIGGYGAHHAAGLFVPWLEEEHDVEVEQPYVYVAVAACALLGGFYLSSAKDGLIDTAAGIAGALLCAEGILVVIGTHEDLADKIGLDAHFSYYFAGTAILLWWARSSFMTPESQQREPKLIMA